MEKREEFSRYLQHLGILVKDPCLRDLPALIDRHLKRIPYETFSKFYYWRNFGPYVPSVDEFVSALQKGWGGNCYTLNFQFVRLLRFLGFRADLVKVEPQHAGIIVWEGENPWYVDVGYGWDSSGSGEFTFSVELDVMRAKTR